MSPARRRGRIGIGSGLLGSPTVRVVGKRLLQAVPVLWGTTFLSFCLLNLLPGDAAQALLGENATEQDVAALRARLHLDQPFFERYLRWLGGVLTGNFDPSLTSGQSIAVEIMPRLLVSAEILVYVIVLSVLLTITVAVLAARRPRGVVDRISIGVSMIGLSAPHFVFALVLIYVFAVFLGVVPALGYVGFADDPVEHFRSLALPVATLVFVMFCGDSRQLRADLVDQLEGEDYIRTARAKGVPPWGVLLKHALRNSVFTLLTVVGGQVGLLIGGTVVLEQIFAIPGMGQGLMQAITFQDIPMVQTMVLIIAAAVVLANLVTDLLYAVLDPRIRHGRPNS
jgi:peptide/nickel transport system permease protein